jgi:hypothetical protein
VAFQRIQLSVARCTARQFGTEYQSFLLSDRMCLSVCNRSVTRTFPSRKSRVSFTRFFDRDFLIINNLLPKSRRHSLFLPTDLFFQPHLLLRLTFAAIPIKHSRTHALTQSLSHSVTQSLSHSTSHSIAHSPNLNSHSVTSPPIHSSAHSRHSTQPKQHRQQPSQTCRTPPFPS